MKNDIDANQLKMIRIQQGIWNQQSRVILLFEGFDASGKGGAIRHITEGMDPRGFRVHPIGPPEKTEQEIHYLYRFWTKLPLPGTIAIFDRSWYGRLLVERVENLAPKKRIEEAFDEIHNFEKTLVADGIELIKFFLKISPEEQLKRFEKRVRDPFKQWKIKESDFEMRSKWDDYISAAEEIFRRTSPSFAPWNVIDADRKEEARQEIVEVLFQRLECHVQWIESKAAKQSEDEIKKMIKRIEQEKRKK